MAARKDNNKINPYVKVHLDNEGKPSCKPSRGFVTTTLLSNDPASVSCKNCLLIFESIVQAKIRERIKRNLLEELKCDQH